MSRKLPDPYFIASHNQLDASTERALSQKPLAPGWYWGHEMSPVHGPYHTSSEALMAAITAAEAGEI